MGSTFALSLSLRSGKVPHINLQRIAGGFITQDELAGKLNLFLRDLVQGIDFGVIHDGHVQTAIHRFVHEDAV